ncbi:hypothetical protein GCM10022268_12990 [Sphingomonas cynarae]|uniref:SCP domain-containing protein n=2 Tax=Sphingomonas cynarae TaxID=930197 RepID=A0ABP7DI60_9SPHN
MAFDMGLAKVPLLSVCVILASAGIAASLAAAPAALTPPRPVPTADALQQAMLDAHRQARAQVGLPPLAWNDDLAAAARDHAAMLARMGTLRHADQPSIEEQGENLWAGTRGAYAYREMIAAWADEAAHFVNAPTPQFSRTGQWQDVGHYAQIVWRDTREVGCAMASDPREDYLVCRYRPAGNIVGRPAF